MLAFVHVIDQPEVWITSWVELLTIATLGTIIVGFIGLYHHIECHQDGCHRLGRFQHGHLKLCHVHHPLVPEGGKITTVEIDNETKRKEGDLK